MTSVESSAAHSPERSAPRAEESSGIVRPRAELPLSEDVEERERPLIRRRVAFTPAPVVINLDSPPSDVEGNAATASALEGGHSVRVAPVGSGQGDAIASAIQLTVPVAKRGVSSLPTVLVGESSANVLVGARASTSRSADGGRGTVGGGSDSESDLDPDDVRMLQEGHTRTTVHVEGRFCYVEIPTE